MAQSRNRLKRLRAKHEAELEHVLDMASSIAEERIAESRAAAEAEIAEERRLFDSVDTAHKNLTQAYGNLTGEVERVQGPPEAPPAALAEAQAAPPPQPQPAPAPVAPPVPQPPSEIAQLKTQVAALTRQVGNNNRRRAGMSMPTSSAP